MARYVAFLRAINVGGHTVKMDVLREEFEAMGATAVETFIASGNVLFDSPKGQGTLEKGIETHLGSAFGYEVATFLRSDAEVRRIAARRPFEHVGVGAGDRVYVNFLRRPPSAAVKRDIVGLGTDDDHLAVIGPEVYWLRRGTLSESTLDMKAFDRLIGVSTNRNFNTIQKIAAKLA